MHEVWEGVDLVREIKFRGKQIKSIESIWQYGDLLHSKDNKVYIQNTISIFSLFVTKRYNV